MDYAVDERISQKVGEKITGLSRGITGHLAMSIRKDGKGERDE